MQYRWKPGSRLKANANDAGKVLDGLRQSGSLTRKALVEASRPDDAPLHGEFEWDDATAAEMYRENQAGYIIRSIEVSVEGASQPVRAFFKVSNEASGYESIQRIMQVRETRESLLDCAKGELRSFKSKYSMLEELSEVFKAIDGIA